MPEHVKVDFGTLKANVLIGAVLEKYGVKYRQPNKEYLRADCPLPSHTSKESKGSFAVNLAKNIWCCKSTSCNETAKKKGGDVLDFVSLMEQTSVLNAAKKLLEWFPISGKETSRKSNEVSQPIAGAVERTEQGDSPHSVAPTQSSSVTENRPLTFELKGITYHPYLESRGISEELALKFGVGFFPGKGSMSGRLVFPIRNEKGELVAYAGRAVDNSEPRYRLPAGFHKGLVLYNRHAVKGEAVTVVEGFFDCLKVCAAGFPCIALMGCTLTEAQEKLLNFKYITLLLDGDKAGQDAALEIAPRLAKGHYVRIVSIEGQPDSMSPEEIKSALRVNGACAA